MDELLVAFGGELKALGDGRIGGYLVRFGDPDTPDLTGDFFTKATDFDIEDGDKVTYYFDHGLDPTLKNRKLGRGTVTVDDFGVWTEGILNRRDEYEDFIYRQIEAGKMGLSSGSLPHLVHREPVGAAKHITAWPLGKDASITPTPAEPRTSVLPLKSLLDSQQQNAPEAPPEAREGGGAAKTHTADIQIVESFDMAENEVQTPPADELKSLGGKVDALSESVARVMQWMDDQPSIKNAGYVSQDGGKADPELKSLGDFLKAVQRKDEKRLQTIYGSLKAMNEGSGESGGYLVPPEYNSELLRLAIEQSPILQRVRRVPVSSNNGKWPALDNTIVPTGGTGQTAGAAGLRGSKRAEGGAYTETEPDLTQIEWRVNDAISGYTKVTKELNADSPQAIEALLRMLISIADGAKQEHYVIAGNGVGEPLGVLNAPATIEAGTDNGAFTYSDALAMKAKFHRIGGQAGWYIHKSVWPDIGSMEVGTAGGAVYQANLAAELGGMLLGYGVAESEHLPQKGAKGSVLLADFSAYLLFERGGLEIDFSEHADFLNGNVVWRFSRRLDGQPWLKNKITLAGPGSAYTVSPFVILND